MDKPLILSLDSHGVPHRWISWQQACFYYAKNLVAWTLGDETFTYYGGISRLTGERSSITAHSIVAIKGKALAAKGFNHVPPLNNRELFRRNRLPQESGLELLYAPYVPNKAEYLILTNRRILADQMEFLKQHLASHSRLVLAPA